MSSKSVATAASSDCLFTATVRTCCLAISRLARACDTAAVVCARAARDESCSRKDSEPSAASESTRFKSASALAACASAFASVA